MRHERRVSYPFVERRREEGAMGIGSRKVATALAGAAVIALGGGPAAAAAQPSAPWKNCTEVHKRYPHGVGKANARDRTKSHSSEPVTSFKRSTSLYNTAMKYNRDLDRDKDGIACEAH
jgi:hypothetical protein